MMNFALHVQSSIAGSRKDAQEASYFVERLRLASSLSARRFSHRRNATMAKAPSTTPNGQVKACHPYREDAAQASAKTSTHQEERYSSA